MNAPSAAPQQKDHMDALGASLLIGFSALLGLNQALVKLVNAGFAPIFQGGLRSAFAFLLILGWALWQRKALNLRDGSAPWGLLIGVFFAAEFALLFLALDYTSVSRVSLFFYTMPFFVALGAHFLFPGERLNGPRLAGLGLALSGVALGLQDKGDNQASTWVGDLLALSAALFWAGIALLTRATVLARVEPAQNLLYQLGVSAILLLALAPFAPDMIRDVTPTIIGIFAFQVVAIASFGFLIWMWILTIYPVSNMASFSLLTPLFGVFFGWWIFDDAITPTFIGALILVASGLLLINRRKPD